MKLEKIIDLSHSLHPNKSLIESVTMSETTQKSAGHGDPPKGSHSEIIT
jgi:hypothetical protein